MNRPGGKPSGRFCVRTMPRERRHNESFAQAN